MTTEEAIVEFEKQLHSAVVVLDSGFGTHPGENDRIYRKRKEMAEIALSALRAQQEAENQKSLTLDELREMDAPVWCLCKPFPFEGENGFWCLCKKGDILTPAGTRFHVDNIPNWVFMRNKPREGAK